MGKANSGKPASGKKKEGRGRSGDGPPVYGALIAAAVAIAIALLSTASWYLRGKGSGQPDSKASGTLSEEQIKLMSSTADLREKIEKIAQQALSLDEQKRKAEEEKKELESIVAEAKAKKNSDKLGPSVMQAQGKLLQRLLEMTKEYDALRGDDKKEERVAAAPRVEAELAELEAQAAQEDVSPAVRKQQAALIALVRSAMQKDRSGEGVADDAEWNEEALLKKHGLITYASPVYWEEAFADRRYGDSFEWYGAWEEQDSRGVSLASLVRPLLKPSARTLVLGCGNSNLSAVLHQEGQRSMMSVDISEAVIQQMQTKHAELDGMEWRTMDATKMDFGDGAFDFIIEKGMFDALHAGSGEKVKSALSEVVRVLQPGAQFVSVSFQNNRLAKLFGEPSASAALDCELAGDVLYQKEVRSSVQTDSTEKESATSIFVYVCKRRA